MFGNEPNLRAVMMTRSARENWPIIRAVIEQFRLSAAFFWVDDLDIHLLATVDY